MGWRRGGDGPVTGDTTAGGAPAGTPRAAYGLLLPDLPGAAHLLRGSRGGEVEWRVERRVADVPTPAGPLLTAERAELPLPRGGRVEISRAGRRTVITSPVPVPDTEVVHPHLASTAVTVAHWQGRLALHAAAVVAGGSVWAVLGDRGAGKSTTVLALARAGCPVVTDDVLVLDGTRALPGPRCIDLRAPAAAHYGTGEELGRVGSRERWRVGPAGGEPPADLHLAGFVELAFGGRARVEAVPGHARVPLLLRGLALKVPPADPGALLRLAALPVVRFTRPRDLGSLDASVRLLLAELTGGPAGPATPATRAAAG
ncbi:hypothetical protein NUM3379_08560 [Kineococcus sp. NUM-3379]